MSIELVEVVRSGFRECVHRGSAVILDANGDLVVGVGEIHTPIYPRSANKPLQAVAALRNGFEPSSPEELAVAAASHAGEADHIELVEGLLERYGRSWFRSGEVGNDLGLSIERPRRNISVATLFSLVCAVHRST